MSKPVGRWFKAAVAAAVLVSAPVVASAAGKQLTNADVEKMVSGKLAPQTIIMTIQSSSSRFDTSPDQLIRLSNAGVPQDVIEAMISASNARAAAPATASRGSARAAAAPAAASASAMRADEVVMLDGAQRVSMSYSAATTRTAARALGFGGAAMYASLQGPRAPLRVATKRPSFEVAVPSNARPDGFVTLALLEVRRNGNREVSIAGGGAFGGSFSTGIHPDRIIATSFEPSPSQGNAPSGYTVYRVTPRADLASGEYALVPSTTQAQSVPFGGAPSAGNYFDFGVN